MKTFLSFLNVFRVCLALKFAKITTMRKLLFLKNAQFDTIFEFVKKCQKPPKKVIVQKLWCTCIK